MLHILLIIHILSATIWVGGHILLLTRYLPKAFKDKNVRIIIDYESQFEFIGIPALLIQVVTGIWMSFIYQVKIDNWFSFSTNIEKIISIKLILLLVTIILAVHARIFIIPKLGNHNLPLLTVHIILVTFIAISMLVLGTFVRMGTL